MKHKYIKPLLSEMLKSKDIYELSVFLSYATDIPLSKWYFNDLETIREDLKKYSHEFQSSVIIFAFIECHKGKFTQFSLLNSFHHLLDNVIHGVLDPNSTSDLLILLIDNSLESKINFFNSYNLNVEEFKVLLKSAKDKVNRISDILDKLISDNIQFPVPQYFDFLTLIHNTLDDILYIKIVKESIASDLEELKKEPLNN